MDDKLKTDAISIIEPDQGSGLVSVSTNSVNREVEIKVVEDISEFDYGQTEATLKAIHSAGMNPALVAHGLNVGHGYSVREAFTTQPFQINNKVSGIQRSEEAIVAYRLRQAQERQNLIASAAGENALIISERGLTVQGEGKIVDLAVFIRSRQPKIENPIQPVILLDEEKQAV